MRASPPMVLKARWKGSKKSQRLRWGRLATGGNDDGGGDCGPGCVEPGAELWRDEAIEKKTRLLTERFNCVILILMPS
jgi:hypothetical protein